MMNAGPTPWRLVGTAGVCLALALPVPAAFAAPPAPPPAALVEAAKLDAEAFLDALRNAIAAAPGDQEQLLAAARRLRPDLAARLTSAAFPAPPPASPPPAATPPPVHPAAAGLSTAGGIAGVGPGTIIAGLGGLVAAGVGAAAGGGGGGGEDAAPATSAPSSSGGTGPVTPPHWDPDPTPVGDTIETAEYQLQIGLGLIKAADAYARGATGAGQIVGVVDTGLDLDHSEFDGRVADTGWDYVADAPVTRDGHGHGTHVAGIIGAKRDGADMHGVAFDAGLVPFLLLNSDGNVGANTETALPDMLSRMATLGGHVVNHSWGSNSAVTDWTAGTYAMVHPKRLAGYRTTAVTNDIIQVWATGNDGRDEPSLNAGLPALFPELEDVWVAVTSVSHLGQLTDYGNACGVAAAWCVAAPGGTGKEPIISTARGGGTRTAKGTSMAAPQVSGALAVLMELFPGLTPQQVVDRLFATASRDGITDRNGDPATAADVGHGLIDLEAASQPIGAMSLVSGTSLASGTAFDPASSTLSLGGAFGDGVSTALAAETVTVFDSLGGGFDMPLAGMAAPADPAFDMPDAMDRLSGRTALQVTTLPGGRTAFAYGASTGTDAREVASGARLALTTETGGLTWEATRNISPADGFGLRARQGALLDTFAVPDVFTAPWLGWAEDGQTLSLSADAPWSGRLRVAGFSGAAPDSSWLTVDGMAAEWRQPLIGGGTLGVMGGTLRESASLLGTRGSGAFTLAEDVPTAFAGLSLDVPLSDHLTLAGSLHMGWTRPETADVSLIGDVSLLRSESASLGLIGTGLFDDSDRFGVAVHQPLRIGAGSATFDLPAGRTADGGITRRRVDLSLTPTGREIDLQAFYGMDTGDRSRLDASLMLRLEPGHVADAEPEAVGLIRWKMDF